MAQRAKKQRTFPLNVLIAGSKDYMGYCLDCGAEREECEPDARHYECDSCGENNVFGAEELIMMCLYHEAEQAAENE